MIILINLVNNHYLNKNIKNINMTHVCMIQTKDFFKSSCNHSYVLRVFEKISCLFYDNIILYKNCQLIHF